MAACAIKPEALAACSTLRRLTRIALARSTLRDEEEPIAQLQYWLNSYSKYNIPPKALPLLVCTKNTALARTCLEINTALGFASRCIYLSIRPLVLYFHTNSRQCFKYNITRTYYVVITWALVVYLIYRYTPQA